MTTTRPRPGHTGTRATDPPAAQGAAARHQRPRLTCRHAAVAGAVVLAGLLIGLWAVAYRLDGVIHAKVRLLSLATGGLLAPAPTRNVGLAGR